MTALQKLQGELDECLQISRDPGRKPDERKNALFRAQAIITERMALTSEPVVDGGEAELQRMIAEGPHM